MQGETEHKRCKQFYRRTNKNQATKQIAHHEARARFVHNATSSTIQPSCSAADSNDEEYANVPPEAHHQVPYSSRKWVDLRHWLHSAHKGDPALKVCLTFSILAYHAYFCHRTSILACRTTSYDAAKNSHLLVVTLSTPTLSASQLVF